jgi:excisionase family DNA binding protein
MTGARIEANAIEDKLDQIVVLLGKLVSKESPKARRLLRVAEAADYLSVSRWQLRGIVQRGDLPIIKPSNGDHAPWLVDVRDLDAWVERTKTNF